MAWLADYADPHNFAFPFLHSKGDLAFRQNYKNPLLDRLVEEAVLETDASRRTRLYHRIQEAAYEDAPQLWLTPGLSMRTQRSWVKGWTFNPIFPDTPYGAYYYSVYKAEGGGKTSL